MWVFLNSKFGVVVVGFVLTTIAGAVITQLFQRASWKRETRVALLRARFDEGTKLLESLSQLVGRRFFATQRYLWAIQNTKDYDIQAVRNEYFEVICEWNGRMWEIRNKLRLLLSEEYASAFLDYRDDSRPDHPKSLHYQFVQIGKVLKLARDAKMSANAAQKQVYYLNYACSNFLEAITTNFVRRASALELLKFTEAQKATPRPEPS